MPLPKPHKGESEDDFVSRCMGADAMKEDFPDKDQRLAVCFNQWRKDKEGKAMSETTETRVLSFDAAELRVSGEGEKRKLTGRAVPFNAWSEDLSHPLGSFREKIMPGALQWKDRDILVTFEHRNDALLGRTSSGTARLTEKKGGIYYEVDLPPTRAAEDLIALVERGDIRGNSFEFIADSSKDEWSEKGDERVIHSGTLYQVGPVASPAYARNTSVALRSWKSWQESHKSPRDEIEDLDLALDLAEAGAVE